MSAFSRLAKAGIVLSGVIAAPAYAANLIEPTVFASSNGVLDLLIVAKQTKATGFTISGYRPPAAGYQVCYRPPTGRACPAGTPIPYGGVRLQLQRRDTLKIRFVNALPAIPTDWVDRIVDDPLLALNPTNLHTHGLIVDALPNSTVPPAVPRYGDFVFTSVFNPANGDPAAVNAQAYNTLHSHGDVVKNGLIDYEIKIPYNHPSGSFWFHPHMHGIAVNQISAGLSGIITVGNVADYACGDGACTYGVPDSYVRHMILKEMQVTPDWVDGKPQFQTDAAFCPPDPLTGETQRKGACPADRTAYPQGGYWFFTLNGQQFPTVPVGTPEGEIWRITNASASMTYDLVLQDNRTKKNMPMQLVSVDGVSINVPADTQSGDIVKVGSARMRYATCPTGPINMAPDAQLFPAKTRWAPEASDAANKATPICASEIFMMPSSRVEVWATYSDAQNRLAAAPTGQSATLKNLHYNAGPVGDDWPAVDLARVTFAPGGLRRYVGQNIVLHGDALRQHLRGGIFREAREAMGKKAAANCAPLPAGHRRRVYFANMGDDTSGNPIFGLGYEQIDANGVAVPGTYQAVERFNPDHQICLPLSSGNNPAVETWELINLSQELHNFHIHQTRFKVLNATAPAGSMLASNSTVGAGVMEDNIPLPFATAAEGYTFPDSGACSVDEYRAGKCKATPILVQIPFTRVGQFVYHCHILEHEDGGMMHVIRVQPSM